MIITQEEFLKEMNGYKKYISKNTSYLADEAGVSLDTFRNAMGGRVKNVDTLQKIIQVCRQFVVDGAKMVPGVKVVEQAAEIWIL